MSNNWDKVDENVKNRNNEYEKNREELLQEEFRRVKERYDREHLELEKQAAEKRAIEERNRRNMIYTKIENARFGLIFSGVLTLILILLLITKTGEAFGMFVTLIVAFGFGIYAVLGSSNPFLPFALLVVVPIAFFASLPIFVGGWHIIWIIIILVTAISSFVTLHKYQYYE